MGIEPTPSAWKAEVLPLNYTRLTNPTICRSQKLAAYRLSLTAGPPPGLR